jgi:uroporphyrinogen-III synthase
MVPKQMATPMDRMPLQPLEGYTVGITADRRAAEQAELLRRRGARVLVGPTIATAYLGSDERLHRATEQVIASPPDVLVITTGIGIRAWIEAAQSWGLDHALLAALSGARVLSRGPKAAAAAQALGLDVWASAPDERMTGVQALLAPDVGPDTRVAVQCFGDDTDDVAASLAGIDAVVSTIPVYRWQLPPDLRPAEALVRATLDGRVHAITFTSAPAVRNLLDIAGEQADELRVAMNGPVVAACVGPACAEAARAVGIDEPLAPSVGRLGLMVRALSERLEATRDVIQLADVTVELQGHAALVGREHVQLTRREAGVLAALAAKPGAVVSRTTLLRTVWAGASDDEHVVGVTVGRLRRKLGDAGASVLTVPRRGYRLETAAANTTGEPVAAAPTSRRPCRPRGSPP